MKLLSLATVLSLGALSWSSPLTAEPSEDFKKEWRDVGEELKEAYGASRIELQRSYDELSYKLSVWKEKGKETSGEAWEDLKAGLADVRKQLKEMGELSQEEVQKQWASVVKTYNEKVENLKEWDAYPEDVEESVDKKMAKLEKQIDALKDADEEEFDDEKKAVQKNLNKVTDQIDYWANRAAINGEAWAEETQGDAKEAKKAIVGYYERALNSTNRYLESMKKDLDDSSSEAYEELVEARDEAAKKLDKLQDASGDAWNEALDDAEAGWNDFKDQVSSFSEEAGERIKNAWNELW